MYKNIISQKQTSNNILFTDDAIIDQAYRHKTVLMQHISWLFRENSALRFFLEKATRS